MGLERPSRKVSGGQKKGVPTKPALWGRGEAKSQVVFSACGKYRIVTCAPTKAVGESFDLWMHPVGM